MSGSEAVGLSGALLAGYAYLPQVTHLVRERCSSGLSERAFALWLVASMLMTAHAITIGAVVFVVLGIQQVGATGLIAFYCRVYRGRPCPSHDPNVSMGATTSATLHRPIVDSTGPKTETLGTLGGVTCETLNATRSNG